MADFKNILLINFGGIGDEILFFPVIDTLKKSFPQAKLSLVLEPRSASASELNNNISDVIKIDVKGKTKYFELLKLYFKMLFGNFDLVVSSGGNPLISLLLFLSGIKTRVGYSTSKLAKCLLTHPVQLNKEQYAAKMYFDLVKDLTKSEFENPKISVQNFEREQNSVLVHPGVSKISVQKNIQKTLTPDCWAKIVSELINRGKKVYLAGGKDDIEVLDIIRSKLGDNLPENFVDLASKKMSLREFADYTAKVETIICSDSAPMHVGVGVNTKTIAIFGPTDDEKLLPKSEKFIAVKNDVLCRPCLWAKRNTTCDKLSCLDIEVEQILINI